MTNGGFNPASDARFGAAARIILRAGICRKRGGTDATARRLNLGSCLHSCQSAALTNLPRSTNCGRTGSALRSSPVGLTGSNTV
jgi:hypothetical protein